MTKFFRKIRQNLVSEGKTGKPASQQWRYFKYAIGEIILVVIGILIAIQINNWNEYRKDRNKEINLYTTIINSLESDYDDVNIHLTRIEKVLQYQEIFITKTSVEISNEYSIEQIDSMVLFLRRTSSSFFPNYKLYDKISSNNAIELIRSQEVKEKLRELYEQTYVNYQDLDLNIEQQAVFSLFNNYFSKIVHKQIEEDKIDHKLFIDNFDLLNEECRKIHYLTRWTRNSMKKSKNDISSLLHILKEKELLLE